MPAKETVVPLKHPITVERPKLPGSDATETQEIAELRLTRVKGKHLRASDKASGDVGKILAILAAITGVPEKALEELDAEDFAAVAEKLDDFLPKQFRATGAGS